jgi:hypothetical protein
MEIIRVYFNLYILYYNLLKGGVKMNLILERLNNVLEADKIEFVENGQIVGRIKNLSEIAKSDNPKDLVLAKLRRNRMIMKMLIDKYNEQLFKELEMMNPNN